MEKQVEIYLVKELSKKDNKTEYFKLVADFGYREQVITFDTALIISLLDCPMSTLYELCKNVGEKIVCCKLDFNVD